MSAPLNLCVWRRWSRRFRLFCVLLCLSAVSGLQAAVTDGITAYWSFDGHLNDQAHGAIGSSSLVADVGIFDGDVTSDGIEFSTGLLGTHALLLNGGSGAAENDGHVRIVGSDDTHFGDSDTFTVSLWVRAADLNIQWQAIFAHGEQSEYRIARFRSTSSAALSVGTTNVGGSADIGDGNWHHIVAINEAGVSSRLYIDGVLEASDSALDIVDDLTSDLLIGANPEVASRREWDGWIDDAALWNRALTSTEIAEIYNGGTGKSIDAFFEELGEDGVQVGMTAYWDFDGDLVDSAESLYGAASTVADDGVFDGANGTDGISYDVGLFGSQALLFNGGSGAAAQDGHVRVTGSADTHFEGLTGFSLSVWFKVTNFETRWQTLIAHGEQSEYRIARYQSSSQMASNLGSGDVNGGPDIEDGNWHHMVAISEDGVNTRHYIDGLLVATGGAPSLEDDLAQDLLIGGNPEISSIREWSGYVEEVALWNRILTPQEVSAIYNGGSGASLRDLVGSLGEIAVTSILDNSGVDADILVNVSAPLQTVIATLGLVLDNSAGTQYSLVAGDGDTDNASYGIGGSGGDELLINVDLSGSGVQAHTIRLRAERDGVISERVVTLSLMVDSDFDALPDDYELSSVGNLSDLNGALNGPGPGAGTGDFDGDTFTDLEEYHLALDPVLDDSDLIPGLDLIGSLGAYMDGALPEVTPNSDVGNWGVENAFPNLSFASLIGVSVEPNSSYIHALERRGSIQRVDASDPNTTVKTEILDISDLTVNGDNGGLRSVVFHPEYNVPTSPNRNYVYIFYTTDADLSHGFFTDPDGSFFIRLSRFERDESTGVLDRNSELVMIQQKTRDLGQHFSGGLTFDADGYLVVTIGDLEYDANDVLVDFYQDSQRIDRIFQSAILRLDVDMDVSRSSAPTRTLQGSSGPNAIAGTDQSCLATHNYYHVDNLSGVGYWIPNDNYFKLNPPAAGSDQFVDTPVHGDPLEEHQALGVRNPWRITTDPVDGDIVWFNVGSNSGSTTEKFEEVELLTPGGNYGWPYFEGSISKGEMDLPPTQYAPVYVGTDTTALGFYNHDTGRAITGGVFYYGSKFPSLYGKVVLGDARDSVFHSLDYKNLAEPVLESLGNLSINPYQMVVDPTGEDILIAAAGTTIYKLNNDRAMAPEPPSLLSDTGVFEDMNTLQPHAGLLEYEPASPLWSDRATKLRWIGLPNAEGDDAAFDLASEKIVYSSDGEWTFPVGTTFIKHFDLPLDEGDPSNPDTLRRMETRFFVRAEDGAYYAFTYKWRADGTEADLLTDADTQDVTVTRADGTTYIQTWEYPSRTQCFECHQTGAGVVLGVKSRQLNHPIHYAGSGRISNQLATMRELEMFEEPQFESSEFYQLLSSSRIDDETAPLEHRVRSYLDSNCAMCHRPEASAGRAQLDLLLTTDLADTGLVEGAVQAGNLGLANPHIVDPGDTANSILYLRDKALGDDENRMPPLARSLEDTEYIEALGDWIQQIGMSRYNTWVQTNQIKGTPESDEDGDTIQNIVEYVVGLDGTSIDNYRMPVLVENNGDYIFTLPVQGDALADGIVVKIEDSGDLIHWFEAGTANSGVEVIGDTATVGVDGELSVRLLDGSAKRFIRISVEVPGS